MLHGGRGIRIAAGREAGLSTAKLEVIGDQRIALPDNEQLLEATVLVRRAVVLPYTTRSAVAGSRRGAAAVMRSRPIGAGLGIQNVNMRIIRFARA